MSVVHFSVRIDNLRWHLCHTGEFMQVPKRPVKVVKTLPREFDGVNSSLGVETDGSESNRVIDMQRDLPTSVDISPIVAQFRDLGGVAEQSPADQKHFPDIIHAWAVS